MWNYLIPLLALIAGRCIHALEFTQSIQVQFIISSPENKNQYAWRETTNLTADEASKAEWLPLSSAQVLLRGTDDGRSIEWRYGKDDDGDIHQCDVWLESQPDVPVFSYNLNTATKTTYEANAAALAKLHVMCDGYPEDTPPGSQDEANTRYIPSQDLQQPIPPSSDSDTIHFSHSIMVSFFGDHDKMPDSVWWRDGTYDYVSDDGDKMEAGDLDTLVPQVEGSDYLGQMQMTHTPSSGRFYHYLTKSDPDDKAVHVQGCRFNVTADPSSIEEGVDVDAIYFWVDSDRLEARKSLKSVDVDAEKIRGIITNYCQEDPNGEEEMKKTL